MVDVIDLMIDFVILIFAAVKIAPKSVIAVSASQYSMQPIQAVGTLR
jgi:hypothetical protein